MARTREIFICRSCGGAHSRWMGRCPDCGAWDSLASERISSASAKRDPQKGLVEAWAALEDGQSHSVAVARPIDEVGREDAIARISTGIGELDRVLGGATGPSANGHRSSGLVPGSAVLIGGPPGIGKSTLMLQACASLASRGTRILYVSSEESAEQVRARADRLSSSTSSLDHSVTSSLFLLSDTNLARIVEQTRKVLPKVLVIDSVQMVYRSDLPAGPGSVTQLRRCCSELVYLAKVGSPGTELEFAL